MGATVFSFLGSAMLLQRPAALITAVSHTDGVEVESWPAGKGGAWDRRIQFRHRPHATVFSFLDSAMLLQRPAALITAASHTDGVEVESCPAGKEGAWDRRIQFRHRPHAMIFSFLGSAMLLQRPAALFICGE